MDDEAGMASVAWASRCNVTMGLWAWRKSAVCEPEIAEVVRDTGSAVAVGG